MFNFPSAKFDQACIELRNDVRGFLDDERDKNGFTPSADCWVSCPSPEFSRKLGASGWLGMTWPKSVGGHQRPALHRYIVTEELLAAGAPVAAHWIADRQSGAQILRYGTDAQKMEILPKIARGECYFAIGMSEPQAGSDLAAVKTSAQKVEGGWLLNGRKIWSTGAHFCHYMLVLVRTSPPDGRDRQQGLSQFLVDLSLPGIEISGIEDLSGVPHFNETLFEDTLLPDDALLGVEGNGWHQVMAELAMERSGPERFLTSFILLEKSLPLIANQADDRVAERIGKIVAHLKVLRRMSLGITCLLQEGRPCGTEAAMVKELGNRFENEVVRKLRSLLAPSPIEEWPTGLSYLLRDTILHLPSNTLRGGTTEILRGIIARQLGMR